MSQQIGLFGYPLGHSISPALQQAALDHYSLPVRYCAWPTPPSKLSVEINKLRRDDYLGANVTIPHKERAGAFLDRIDPWARIVRAVNTIVKDGLELVGHNTDAYGFVRGLREVAGFEPRDRSVLLLGAGGAARAASFGLAEEAIASLTIANRTPERARSLADDVRDSIASVAAVPLEKFALAEAAAKADLIVNATSMGMSRGDARTQTPLRADLIPPSALVYDMVYTPTETPLLLEARKAGARGLGGLPMLVYQGAASFELWTGREAPIEVMFRAAKRALAGVPSVD
jgi:shikimate dehydrogenase